MWLTAHFETGPEIDRALFGANPRNQMTFRKWLASANDRYRLDIPRQFFGYSDSGVPLQSVDALGTSPTYIGISAYGRGLKLYAIGRESIALLLKALPGVHSSLIRDAGQLVRLDIKEGKCKAEFNTGNRFRYYIDSMLASKSRRDDKTRVMFENLAEAGQNPLVNPAFLSRASELVDRGLSRQYWAFEDDIDTESTYPYGDPDRLDIMGCKVHAIGGHAWSVASSSGKGVRLVLKGIEFTSPVKLGGLWLTGNAISRGEGIVQHSSVGWGEKEKAA